MRDISLHLLDIIRNSVSAQAKEIDLDIFASADTGFLELTITDDGTGMDAETLLKVTNPFYTTRTTRKIGLGIPLFKASAEQAGGEFLIISEKGKGTTVKAVYAIDNVDRPPLGNISDTVTGTILSEPQLRIRLLLRSDKETFSFDTMEVKERLSGVPITQFDVLDWIKEYIEEGIGLIFGGVLNEVIS
jgi:signal transduction histidine kinase